MLFLINKSLYNVVRYINKYESLSEIVEFVVTIKFQCCSSTLLGNKIKKDTLITFLCSGNAV